MTPEEITQIADAVLKRLGDSNTAASAKADEATRLRTEKLLNTPAGSLSANDRVFLAQQIRLAGY